MDIGSHTLIGANVTILPGVKIGHNVIIKAGTIVSKDVPDDTIALETPCKFIINKKVVTKHGTKGTKIIPMTFDENFYRKMAASKYKQRDYRKAAEYYRNVLDLSPEDFDIRLKYADCLNELNLNKKQKNVL